MNIFDVIIIGGGASGMMAGICAARNGKNILILEKNLILGEKLKITGNGRCNITNAEENEKILLSYYGKAEKALYSPFSQFGVKDTFSFFENLGLPLIIEERKRAFPQSGKSLDVIHVLLKELKRLNVTIQGKTEVKTIIAKDTLIEKVILKNNEELFAKSFILATGDQSHPETGSTGDGFRWLEELGHIVEKPSPNIVPLSVQEDWIKKLSGITLSDIKITFYVDNKKAFHLKGDILCTHFGISGPLILNSSKKVSKILTEGIVTAHIDTCPHKDHNILDKEIIHIFDENKNKVLKNVLKIFVPHGSSNVIFELLPYINPEKNVHSITKDERKQIIHLLKALPITITGLMGYEKAVVANGGIELSEVNMKTMQSKKYSNLYITGDLLNIMRPSGGYSLQLCWTTGYIAGNNA